MFINPHDWECRKGVVQELERDEVMYLCQWHVDLENVVETLQLGQQFPFLTSCVWTHVKTHCIVQT